jgi:hypothetical protein
MSHRTCGYCCFHDLTQYLQPEERKNISIPETLSTQQFFEQLEKAELRATVYSIVDGFVFVLWADNKYCIADLGGILGSLTIEIPHLHHKKFHRQMIKWRERQITKIIAKRYLEWRHTRT